jgi:lipopolysaccharide export system permease protein
VKILYRELIKEFVPPLIIANLIMAGILLLDRVFLLIDLLIKKGVNFLTVLELMLYTLPFVLSFSTPIGVLVASIMVFGRISQDNELVAIRSSGINPLKLLIPLIIPLTGLTILMIFFNGYIVAEASYRARNLYADIAQKKPTIRLYEGIFIDDFPGYALYFEEIQEKTGQIRNVTVWQKHNAPSLPILIKAPEGKVSLSPDEKYFTIELKNGTLSELLDETTYRHINFGTHLINLEIDWDLIRRERKYRVPREMKLGDLYKRTLSIKKELKGLKSTLTQLKTGRNSDFNKYQQDEVKTRIKAKYREIYRFQAEIEKRYALAASCLILLFLGSGLGMILKRSGLGVGFIVGLLTYAGYYLIFLMGEQISNAAHLSPVITIWLANLILIPISIHLLSIAVAEESLIKKLYRKILH